MGFSDKKISRIFIQQNLWIATIAIIIGLPVGYVVSKWLTRRVAKIDMVKSLKANE